MNNKMKIKRMIDLAMTVILLALMAFQITGQELHEWLGAGMLVLFLVHNILNFKWYKNLFKGKYSPLRALQAMLNVSILAAVLCLAYSGIIMSGYVFGFISISGQMALARQMHMAASYWGFVLMSVHLGFHWGVVAGVAGKKFRNRKLPEVVPWILRSVAVVIAAYGAVCFYQADILSYMLLKIQFAFFDFGQSGISVFMEYTAMMGLWVFLGYYFAKSFQKLTSAKRKKEGAGR